MMMRRAWALGSAVLALALAVSREAGAQVPGSGVLAGQLVFRVKGCGKGSGALGVTAVAANDGTWAAETSEGRAYAGTHAPLGASGRKLDLQFGAVSESGFVAELAADAASLCGQPVTVTSAVRKKFVLQLNRAGTVAKLTLIYAFTGSAGGRQGTARYRLKAIGPWTTAP